ncbi:cytochrome P460 family protein [Bosea sp. BH3]|uniref:cytochrome P460 family protein n=1 Tax=Bosea sp. BH3 TaxID=2871701 RepID=UPI0021CB5E6C|nr:cytochrome P460 family protein [Bosea sp. BH3]MCU4179682.1 cytochrome P460 family protein [Bosea sp. BH3]
MHRRWSFLAAFAALVGILSSAALAQTSRATFPKDFDEYVLYATYDRGSAKEEAFATRETLAIAKAGKPLPPGTQLVLGIWKNNALTEYFVMEKGVNWGADFPAEVRNGDWHFQQFDLNRQVRRTATGDRCMSCHGSQARSDFLFTWDRMQSYLP